MDDLHSNNTKQTFEGYSRELWRLKVNYRRITKCLISHHDYFLENLKNYI